MSRRISRGSERKEVFAICEEVVSKQVEIRTLPVPDIVVQAAAEVRR